MSTPTTSSEGGRSLEDAYERELTWAFQLTEAGQDEQAMQILTRLLAGYPDNAGLTYTVLAITHSAAGRLEESEAMARQAIAAAPDYSEAHRLLAHALIYQGKELEAEHSLRTALELSPEDVSLFSLMATALTRMGRTEENNRPGGGQGLFARGAQARPPVRGGSPPPVPDTRSPHETPCSGQGTCRLHGPHFRARHGAHCGQFLPPKVPERCSLRNARVHVADDDTPRPGQNIRPA